MITAYTYPPLTSTAALVNDYESAQLRSLKAGRTSWVQLSSPSSPSDSQASYPIPDLCSSEGHGDARAPLMLPATHITPAGGHLAGRRIDVRPHTHGGVRCRAASFILCLCLDPLRRTAFP